MKKLLLFPVAWLALLISVQGQPASAIRISGTRLVYPLFQRWVDEYTRLHPGIKFVVSKSPADSADLLIVSHTPAADDIKDGWTSLVVTRYAQLPVVSNRRKDVRALQSKGFDDPAFRNEQKDIKGIGVAGDDKDLLAAVKRDPNGISYSNLGFLYDLVSRKVIDSIAVIPIDLNGNGKIDRAEDFYGSLDEVIDFVEKTHHSKILLDDVNVLVRKGSQDKDIIPFLQWIITKGQAYDLEYGFINLDAAIARSEDQRLTKINKN